MTADIEAIRARIAAATPGPWKAEWSECNEWFEVTGQPYAVVGQLLACPEVATTDEMEDDGTDADLIAHAPADLAALCDEVEELRGKLENLTDAVTGARSEMDEAGRQLGPALAEEIEQREADEVAR